MRFEDWTPLLLGAVGAAAGVGSRRRRCRGVLLRIGGSNSTSTSICVHSRAGDLSAAGNPNIDLVVVRENTEGLYAGEGGFVRKGTAHEIATQGSVNTRMGVERCIRFAFELGKSGLTSI